MAPGKRTVKTKSLSGLARLHGVLGRSTILNDAFFKIDRADLMMHFERHNLDNFCSSLLLYRFIPMRLPRNIWITANFAIIVTAKSARVGAASGGSTIKLPYKRISRHTLNIGIPIDKLESSVCSNFYKFCRDRTSDLAHHIEAVYFELEVVYISISSNFKNDFAQSYPVTRLQWW
jgi:hypothetical protein